MLGKEDYVFYMSLKFGRLARYHLKICKVKKKNKGHAVSELMRIRSDLKFPGSPVVRALLLHFHC